MPSVIRAICLAFHASAVALLAGTPFVTTSVLGSPLPTPLPLVASFADYVQRSDLVARLQDMSIPVHDYTVSGTKLATSTSERRQTADTSILDNLNLLGNYYSQINENAAQMNTLVGQSSQQGGNADYQQQCISTLSAFHTNLLGFQSTLDALAADKGLENYDQNDELETLLKEIVNPTKYTLSDVYELVANDPTLGPLLGPIVYEVKCILDEVLDAVENLTDAIINAVQPLLQDLIGQATQTACDSGIQVLGLCLAVR
ncbi:predicted protein [Sparassis crispa]|uniref:Uncharacterized protein n=1 Tax=Sparassis crispa TaxID=139825 RepID=A0A401G7Q8_9APHY|nr:predicted protein [Sparassis crispa]GBE78201.1 predicted protein [Sparassis crispa]